MVMTISLHGHDLLFICEQVLRFYFYIFFFFLYPTSWLLKMSYLILNIQKLHFQLYKHIPNFKYPSPPGNHLSPYYPKLVYASVAKLWFSERSMLKLIGTPIHGHWIMDMKKDASTWAVPDCPRKYFSIAEIVEQFHPIIFNFRREIHSKQRIIRIGIEKRKGKKIQPL